MAKSRKDVIMIPWDYTESSEIAFKHAIQLAQEVNNHIMLVRFVEKPGLFAGKAKKEAIINAEKEKLKEVGQRMQDGYGINPFISVELGASAGSVARLVRDAKANLIIVGNTYQLNEKIIFGPKEIAQRLRSIDIPFVITHATPEHTYYKEIVVPLDHDKRYKETLHWIVYLSKYYNCNINIIKPFIDDEFKKKDMSNNIYFTKKMLDKKGIIYGIKTAKKNKNFEDEIIRFANTIDADLIVMMVNKFFKQLGKNMNFNETKPIMVINRNSKIIKYGKFN